MFSYNSPRGWCPRCRGFGELFYLPDVERGRARGGHRGILVRVAGGQTGTLRRLPGRAAEPHRPRRPPAGLRLPRQGPPTIVEVSECLGGCGAGYGDEAAVARARGGNRAGHPAGDSRAVEVPARSRAWAICNWAAAPPRFRAARPSASAWRPNSAPI